MPKISHCHQRHENRSSPYSSSLVAEHPLEQPVSCCLVLFVRNCWNGGSSDSRAGDSRAERPSTADGQRGGTDDSAGAGGSNGTSLWVAEGPQRHTEPRGLLRQWHRQRLAGLVRRCSYAALVHPALKGEMQRVERLPTAETTSRLLDEEQVQASTDLHSTSGPALDRVEDAGSAAGLRAWQLLVERYDPHIRSRTAGQLLSLLEARGV